MAGLIAQGVQQEGCEAHVMSIDKADASIIHTCQAVLFGCPTYFGGISWQMKQFLDTENLNLVGKIGAPFSSAFWTGGGGYELTEMNLIAAMLVKGMVIYTGGVKTGLPVTHFGAVSAQRPGGFDAERCVKLGANIANKIK
jgi:NAD(P)H dehydrogenase (quinone)